MSGEVAASDINGVHQEEFVFNKDWLITTRKSRILQSKCTAPFICNQSKENPNSIDISKLCKLCQYETQIKIPHLPEMTFSDNSLVIKNRDSGDSVVFEPLSALRQVDLARDPLKVAAAEGWLLARADCQHAKNVKKSFDWTFTTEYKGDLIGEGWAIEDTSERIDFAKLSVKEEILFYDELDLFEDELADNGISQLTVKFRAMTSGFYILLRFFLRVDGVLIRMNDTRIYHQANSKVFLREYTNRECTYDELPARDAATLTDPNKLSTLVPIRSQLFHRITFES